MAATTPPGFRITGRHRGEVELEVLVLVVVAVGALAADVLDEIFGRRVNTDTPT